MDYFSSDWHLLHKNILEFDKRHQFKSIEEHDSYIVHKTFKLLEPDDNFYFLGDFVLGNHKLAITHLEKLRSTGANLLFIKGNHDKRNSIELFKRYGTYLGEKQTVKILYEGEEIMVVLDHFSNRVWNRSHHGSYHLYGHSHDSLEKEPWGRSMDVGIMSALRIKGDYLPFSFAEIHEILSKRPLKIIDRHD